MSKIMISVGEASGDIHGASVARAIKELSPETEIFGMGGQNMRAAGVEVIYDIAETGVMGLVEVLTNLPKLFALRDSLGRIMDSRRPDVLVVIDYPGFNMRLAKIAKQKGIPVVSYISPSAWAWWSGRAKEVAETVERVAAIFPFEADIYRRAGANVTFVGHPLLDIVKPSMTKQQAFEYFSLNPAQPVVLLMPGSRRQEVTSLLKTLLAAGELIAQEIPRCQFVLPVASTISREMLQECIDQSTITVQLIYENTYDLMNISSVALAASGTATLETSLLQLPTVIIYKVNFLTYFLGKLLVKIPHIGLPNIVAGRLVVPELLQQQVNAKNIAAHALRLMTEQSARQRTLTDLQEVREKLGSPGAVKKVAQVIMQIAGNKKEGNL